MAVEKLLSQHPVTLMPHVLHILSAFPETMHPTEFLHLLPQVCSGSGLRTVP